MLCTKCKKEIDHLKYTESISGYNYGKVSLNEDCLDYESKEEDIQDAEILTYECPECEETLFTNNKDIIKFLKGNAENKEFYLFQCEKHKIGFNTSCNKCLEEERRL